MVSRAEFVILPRRVDESNIPIVSTTVSTTYKNVMYNKSVLDRKEDREVLN